MCPLLPPPPPPPDFFFFSVACQLRGQSCTFDDSGLPLPHYENVATIFFFRRKNKMWREPPPPPHPSGGAGSTALWHFVTPKHPGAARLHVQSTLPKSNLLGLKK